MLYAKITGLSSYLPDDILDNEALSHMVDTNDEWITTRVGIKKRHILKKEGAGSSYLAAHAVESLLQKTGIDPKSVDLMICATSNPDYRFPSTASVTCGMTGVTAGYAYDIQAACAGFLVALQDANAYIRSGLYKRIIVVCTEKMSSMLNYKDRQTCPLFGDGAAAVLVEPVESDTPTGVIDGVFHIDPSGREHLFMPAGGSVLPATDETYFKGQNYLFQDGRNVYKNAVRSMLSSTLDIMKRNNLTGDDVDWLVPHQANLRIIEAVADRAGMSMDKVLVNIRDVGNTSAASIPICLDQLSDKLRPGDKVVMTAFGAGYTWGAMYYIW